VAHVVLSRPAQTHLGPPNPATQAPPERATSCPLCGSAARRVLATRDRNFRVSQDTFVYRRCLACDALFLTNPPARPGDYYPAAYFPLHTGADLDRHFAPERYKIDLVRRFVTGSRLLEIGTGSGGFLHRARAAGLEAHAIEQDPAAAEWIRRNLGATVHVSDSPVDAIAGLGDFDVVALWHSLEHLDDPWGVLSAIAPHVAAGGVLVIATPNPAAFQLRVLGARWTHLDAPRHTVLIPAASLRRRLAGLGLDQEYISTTEGGGTGWNRYGWQVSLRNLTDRPRLSAALRRGGRIAELALRPVERSGLRGSTYTAVFRRPAP
jgi:2-polyprenyl-3-methyl-5-hydroxy-6-metoxy-1,4-benzoquinol methylase